MLTEIFSILILIIFINKVSIFYGKHKCSVQPPQVKWRLSMTYSFGLTYPTSSPLHSLDRHILPSQNPEGHQLTRSLQHLHTFPLDWPLSLPHTVLNTPSAFMPTTSSWPPWLKAAILCEQSQAFWKHLCYCKTSTNGSCGVMQAWEAAVTGTKGIWDDEGYCEAAMTGCDNGGGGRGSCCNEWPQSGYHWVNCPEAAALYWSFLSTSAHFACVSGTQEGSGKMTGGG